MVPRLLPLGVPPLHRGISQHAKATVQQNVSFWDFCKEYAKHGSNSRCQPCNRFIEYVNDLEIEVETLGKRKDKLEDILSSLEEELDHCDPDDVDPGQDWRVQRRLDRCYYDLNNCKL